MLGKVAVAVHALIRVIEGDRTFGESGRIPGGVLAITTPACLHPASHEPFGSLARCGT